MTISKRCKHGIPHRRGGDPVSGPGVTRWVRHLDGVAVEVALRPGDGLLEEDRVTVCSTCHVGNDGVDAAICAAWEVES